MFDSIAFAMALPQTGAASAGGADMLMQFLPLILMFVIFWFLLIRPQQKRAKEHKRMLSELKRGDHILTSSGLVGRIVEINGEEAMIECGDAKLRVTRGSIGALMESGKTEKTSEKSSGKKSDKTSRKALAKDSGKEFDKNADADKDIDVQTDKDRDTEAKKQA
ncbi:MAG: preprotein translocase subunit YajC [Candidatus Desulfovibrio kirbyi]|uniref:Sec translocon accessory complex subunit YajC n=1 Tax=Candidatus Desulfovibrio kirbyi TaxID=2696086 RepID=A0A6L2R4J3_9BACT|nr:MAG: preprotein translocase subunit YajC [Candidatus Desulfovibrio kirbyi]